MKLPDLITIEELGKEGEEKARLLLKSLGFQLTKPDWLAFKLGDYIQCEIKMKSEPFIKGWAGNRNCDFDGHGLELYQIKRRLSLQEKHNLRCVVIVFEKNSSNIYYQWLDILQQGRYFDTKFGIRIYPLESYILFTGSIK